MPIHIYGTGSGGGGKNVLSVYFTPEEDIYSYTFTIDDVGFARRFNEAKTTKHLDLFFEGTYLIPPNPDVYAIYHVSKGVVNGADAQRMLAARNMNFMEGDGAAMLWDGSFEILGNSASFTVSCVSGVAFVPTQKYRATWICEE